MECKRVPKLPEGDAWVYEPKQDGYRIIAAIDGSAVVLHSMSGLNYTAKHPHIAEAHWVSTGGGSRWVSGAGTR